MSGHTSNLHTCLLYILADRFKPPFLNPRVSSNVVALSAPRHPVPRHPQQPGGTFSTGAKKPPAAAAVGASAVGAASPGPVAGGRVAVPSCPSRTMRAQQTSSINLTPVGIYSLQTTHPPTPRSRPVCFLSPKILPFRHPPSADGVRKREKKNCPALVRHYGTQSAASQTSFLGWLRIVPAKLARRSRKILEFFSALAP